MRPIKKIGFFLVLKVGVWFQNISSCSGPMPTGSGTNSYPILEISEKKISMDRIRNCTKPSGRRSRTSRNVLESYSNFKTTRNI